MWSVHLVHNFISGMDGVVAWILVYESQDILHASYVMENPRLGNI